MKKIGIFYGSTTGNTAKIARRIGNLLSVPDNDIHDIANVGPASVGEYDVLLLGTSTWGSGELQSDWFDFADGMQALALQGKTIALFGTGNEKMKNTFCGGIEKLYDKIKDCGATFIGEFNADGYTFVKSASYNPETGMMRGLVIDDGNKPQLTQKRLQSWTDKIKSLIP